MPLPAAAPPSLLLLPNEQAANAENERSTGSYSSRSDASTPARDVEDASRPNAAPSPTLATEPTTLATPRGVDTVTPPSKNADTTPCEFRLRSSATGFPGLNDFRSISMILHRFRIALGVLDNGAVLFDERNAAFVFFRDGIDGRRQVGMPRAVKRTVQQPNHSHRRITKPSRLLLKRDLTQPTTKNRHDRG